MLWACLHSRLSTELHFIRNNTLLIRTSTRRAMAEQVVCRALGERPPCGHRAPAEKNWHALSGRQPSTRQKTCSAIARRAFVGISGVVYLQIYFCPTLSAAVPAYCLLIASPLFAHICWYNCLALFGRSSSGGSKPSFRH